MSPGNSRGEGAKFFGGGGLKYEGKNAQKTRNSSQRKKKQGIRKAKKGREGQGRESDSELTLSLEKQAKEPFLGHFSRPSEVTFDRGLLPPPIHPDFC